MTVKEQNHETLGELLDYLAFNGVNGHLLSAIVLYLEKCRERGTLGPKQTENREKGGDWDECRRNVISSHGYVCTYCDQEKEDRELHVDHIIPLSRGGTNHFLNLTLACASCNSSKRSKLPSEWSVPQWRR